MENLVLVKRHFVVSVSLVSTRQLCMGLPKPVTSYRKHALFLSPTCIPRQCALGVLDTLMGPTGLCLVLGHIKIYKNKSAVLMRRIKKMSTRKYTLSKGGG